MVAFASSLDQAGAIAANAEDLAYLLEVMAGFDARDSTCLDRPKEDYRAALAHRPVKGLRIGMPREYFSPDLATDVAQPILEAVEALRRLGCETVEVTLPNQHLAVPVYYVLAPAEASSNLSRFDGVRYGHRAAGYSDLLDMYRKTRAEGFGAEVKRRILIGTYVLSHGYYDSYYLQAQRLRRLIARDFAEAFERCDLIVGPAAPSVAFDLGAKRDDPVQMYLDDLYTIPINLAGLPGPLDPVRDSAFAAAPWGCRSSAITSTRHACSWPLTLSSRPPIGTSARRPRSHELGNRHRVGDACAAEHCVEDLLGRVDRLRRAAQHAGLGRGPGAAGRPAGAQPRRGRARDPLRPRGRRQHRRRERLRAQELFLP
jgi:hypothetical protein